MKKYVILVLLAVLISGVGFAQKRKKSMNQGISGVVSWVSSNQMPSPDEPVASLKSSPVEREIYVYALTNQAQTESPEDRFYSNIKTKLIARVKSGKDGKFKIKLPIGNYSLFAKETKGLYANRFDGAMNIFPVRVERNKWSNIEFFIDHQAVY
jgi:hypothetical protein